MKRLVIAFLALMGCAFNKPAVEQAKNNVLTCDVFFARLNDLQRKFQGQRRVYEFEACYELMKQSFPLDFENGTIIYCRETITCDGTDYCTYMEINGESYFIL
jgi:hypothetical protein